MTEQVRHFPMGAAKLPLPLAGEGLGERGKPLASSLIFAHKLPAYGAMHDGYCVLQRLLPLLLFI